MKLILFVASLTLCVASSPAQSEKTNILHGEKIIGNYQMATEPNFDFSSKYLMFFDNRGRRWLYSLKEKEIRQLKEISGGQDFYDKSGILNLEHSKNMLTLSHFDFEGMKKTIISKNIVDQDYNGKLACISPDGIEGIWIYREQKTPKLRTGEVEFEIKRGKLILVKPLTIKMFDNIGDDAKIVSCKWSQDIKQVALVFRKDYHGNSSKWPYEVRILNLSAGTDFVLNVIYKGSKVGIDRLIQWSNDSRSLFVQGVSPGKNGFSDNKSIGILKIDIISQSPDLIFQSVGDNTFAVSPDGHYLAVANDYIEGDGALNLFDLTKLR
ncbi:MAG: hypothetical protein ACXVCP_07510 [Bdellovibrio sp.]